MVVGGSLSGREQAGLLGTGFRPVSSDLRSPCHRVLSDLRSPSPCRLCHMSDTQSCRVCGVSREVHSHVGSAECPFGHTALTEIQERKMILD